MRFYGLGFRGKARNCPESPALSEAFAYTQRRPCDPPKTPAVLDTCASPFHLRHDSQTRTPSAPESYEPKCSTPEPFGPLKLLKKAPKNYQNLEKKLLFVWTSPQNSKAKAQKAPITRGWRLTRVPSAWMVSLFVVSASPLQASEECGGSLLGFETSGV